MRTFFRSLTSYQLLAIAIFVLWSIGRVLNPILRAIEHVPEQGPGPLLSAATTIYVILHAALFAYTTQCAIFLARRRKLHGRVLWEFVFYIYILLALLASLYFIAYEFGFLPSWIPDVGPFFTPEI